MSVAKSRYVQVAILVVVCGMTFMTWMHWPFASSDDDCLLAAVTSNTTKSALNCPVGAILCQKKQFLKAAKASDFNTLRSDFHALVTSIDFQCNTTQRFGREGDGGYEACMAKAVRPKNDSCLVYSFGISQDWSFDEAWAKYGCEVHSFDPSIGMEDHIHAPHINFHNLGLSGNDYMNRCGWKLERLSTIKKRLGHEERIIDALKIDVEGAEWPFLRDVVYADPTALSNVRQLYIELHTPKFRPVSALTETDFAEINDYVRRLRDEIDFRLYKNVQHNYCCGRFSDLMPPGVPEKCCHEVFLVNSRLLAA